MAERWLEREDRGDVTVVRVKVPMLSDERVIDELFHEVCFLLDGAGRRKLVLNLGGVEYFPSRVVGRVAALIRKVLAAHGQLALCQLSPTVEKTLDAAHLIDLVEVHRDEGAALQSLR